jgi:hypothetical protein
MVVPTMMIKKGGQHWSYQPSSVDQLRWRCLIHQHATPMMMFIFGEYRFKGLIELDAALIKSIQIWFVSTHLKKSECIVELEKVTILNLPLSCLCFIDIYLYVVLDVLCCCWIVLIECLCLYCILVSSTSTSRIWNLKLEKQVAYSRIRTQGYNTTIGVLAEWISCWCTKMINE